MELVAVDSKDPTPIYAQLDRGLRAAIATGRLRVGDQLPTVRQLAVELRVNANTVARVYAELERAGILETRRGVGSFVAASGSQARPADEHARAADGVRDPCAGRRRGRRIRRGGSDRGAEARVPQP